MKSIFPIMVFIEYILTRLAVILFPIGFIWLLIIGEWEIIILGFIATPIIMAVFFIFYGLPSMVFVPIYRICFEKRIYFIIFPACFISFIIICVLTSALGIVVQVGVSEMLVHNGNISIPYVIWGYIIVVAPLSIMASYEDPHDLASFGNGTILGLLSAKGTYILATLGKNLKWDFSSTLIYIGYWVILLIVLNIASLPSTIKNIQNEGHM